jgi:nucleoside 2-deoxyribosyltransferase
MPLSPSQRILLIKEIATRLSTEQYPLIDVTLKQFSLPWSDGWDGTKEAYVLRMVEEAPDDALIGLAQHVGFKFEEAITPRLEPPFWRKGMLRLFVSHLAIQRAYAAQLQEVLLEFGISCFIAHNDIEPTLEWQTQIETALATCDVLIALLHENFHASNWTDQEIGFAMGRGVPAFAVSFGQDPYGFIGRFQAFNGNKKTAVALARELFDAYRKNKQTQRRMSEILVGLFEESGSFAEAKARIGFLEDLDLWEPSFSTRVRSAAKTNSQISQSWGVPERVNALLKKWSKTGV